jgi:hypothetical protein
MMASSQLSKPGDKQLVQHKSEVNLSLPKEVLALEQKEKVKGAINKSR